MNANIKVDIVVNFLFLNESTNRKASLVVNRFVPLINYKRKI